MTGVAFIGPEQQKSVMLGGRKRRRPSVWKAIAVVAASAVDQCCSSFVATKRSGGRLVILLSAKDSQSLRRNQEQDGSKRNGGWKGPFGRKQEKEKHVKDEDESGPFGGLFGGKKPEKGVGDKDDSVSEGGFRNPFQREKERLQKTEDEKKGGPLSFVRRTRAPAKTSSSQAIKKTWRKPQTQKKEPIRKPKKKAKKITNPKKDDDKSDSNSSNNPISVVQKVMAGAFKAKEEWVRIFPKTRLQPGEIVPVTVGGIDLLVVASKDGRKLYCIANSCPHLGTPLETGQMVRLPIEDSGETPSQPPLSLASFTERDISNLLSQDGCEDCIVCPLHQTAFALSSGEVRGEWCPYPPVVGKVVGTLKPRTSVAVFDIRTRGKQVEVRINSPIDLSKKGR